MHYNIHFTQIPPYLGEKRDPACWQQADIAEISNFRPESSDHRPKTTVRMVYDQKGIWGSFQVKDQYVRSIYTEYMASVHKDSCVEFFVAPKPEKGYFNFEFNCGGTLHASYITDPTRTKNGFKAFTPLPEALGKQVLIFHSMPKVVEPEIREPVEWFIEFFIPFSLFESFVGNLGDLMHQKWRANFYKCADETSHPHWAAWSKVEPLNFHLPHCFGTIQFQNLSTL